MSPIILQDLIFNLSCKMYKWQAVLFNNLSNSQIFNPLLQCSQQKNLNYGVFTEFFSNNETIDKIIPTANFICQNTGINEQVMLKIQQLFTILQNLPEQIRFEHILVYSSLVKNKDILMLQNERFKNEILQLHISIHKRFWNQLQFKFHPEIISMRRIFYFQNQNPEQNQYVGYQQLLYYVQFYIQRFYQKTASSHQVENFIEYIIKNGNDLMILKVIYNFENYLTNNSIQKLLMVSLHNKKYNTFYFLFQIWKQQNKNNLIQNLLKTHQMYKISEFEYLFLYFEVRINKNGQQTKQILQLLQELVQFVENVYKQHDFIRKCNIQTRLKTKQYKQKNKQESNVNIQNSMFDESYSQQTNIDGLMKSKQKRMLQQNKENQSEQKPKTNLFVSQMKFLLRLNKSLIQLCCKIIIAFHQSKNFLNQDKILENSNLPKSIFNFLLRAFKKQKINDIAKYFVKIGKMIEKNSDEPIDQDLIYSLSFHSHQKQSDLIEIFKSGLVLKCFHCQTNIRKTLFFLVLYQKVQVIFWIFTNNPCKISSQQLLEIIKSQINVSVSEREHKNQGLTFLQFCKKNKLKNVGTLLQYFIDPSEKFICEERYPGRNDIRLESVNPWTLDISQIFERLSQRQKNVYGNIFQIKLSEKKEASTKFKPVAPSILIENYDQFLQMQNQLQKSILLGIDLEYFGYGKGRHQTCLIQIANENCVFVIDVLSRKIQRQQVHEFIRKIMEDQTKIKIFHAFENDVKWLHEDFCLSQRNVNVVDTAKIFAACIEKNMWFQVSLKNLCSKYLNYKMQKKYQKANWRKRPLPVEMIKYAAIDSQVLPHIYLKLLKQIEESQRKATLVLTCVKERYIRSRGFKYQIYQGQHQNKYMNEGIKQNKVQKQVKFIEKVQKNSKVEQKDKNSKFEKDQNSVKQKQQKHQNNPNNKVRAKQKWKPKE